jgi:hypothetical protein
VIRRLVAGMKHAFGLHRPGRRLPVRPDDILLASYPQSGNTWLRFLIANLLHPDREVSFGNLHQLILDPDVTVKRDFDRAQRPRIITSESSFDPRYRRIVYLVRDPRDVVLSQYHNLRQMGRIEDQFPLEDSVERFLRGENNRHLGSWGENAGSWLATRSHHPGFLLLRYEDLLSGTARELTRVAEFVGLQSTPESIAQAIERSSAQPREGEKKQGQSAMPFLPSMNSGSWRNDLREPQIARIETAWSDIMACLGYELITHDPGSAIKSSLIGFLVGAPGGKGEHREEVFAGDSSAAPGSLPKWTAIR